MLNRALKLRRQKKFMHSESTGEHESRLECLLLLPCYRPIVYLNIFLCQFRLSIAKAWRSIIGTFLHDEQYHYYEKNTITRNLDDHVYLHITFARFSCELKQFSRVVYSILSVCLKIKYSTVPMQNNRTNKRCNIKLILNCSHSQSQNILYILYIIHL